MTIDLLQSNLSTLLLSLVLLFKYCISFIDKRTRFVAYLDHKYRMLPDMLL